MLEKNLIHYKLNATKRHGIISYLINFMNERLHFAKIQDNINYNNNNNTCYFCYCYHSYIKFFTHGRVIQASPGKKTMRTIKSPCPFGCVVYLAIAELLISFYI